MRLLDGARATAEDGVAGERPRVLARVGVAVRAARLFEELGDLGVRGAAAPGGCTASRTSPALPAASAAACSLKPVSLSAGMS